MVVIGFYHHSLREVIIVQIVLMTIMLVLVSFPFLRRLRRISMEVIPWNGWNGSAKTKSSLSF